MGSADLVLDEDACFDEGKFCVARNGTDTDVPDLEIKEDFTIGAGAHRRNPVRGKSTPKYE